MLTWVRQISQCRWLSLWITEFKELFLPAQCVGCGKWDTVLCSQCSLLSDVAVKDWSIISGVDGGTDCVLWSLHSYEGTIRKLVLTAKNSHHVDLSGFLYRSGVNLGKAVARSSLIGHEREVWVIPAPSGLRRRLSRRLIAFTVAHGVAASLAESGNSTYSVRVADLVRLKVGAGSQSKRNKEQRLQGRYHSMYARIETVPDDVSLILVDDVVTTGATIREMCRVLGPSCLGVVALCNVRAEMKK